MIDIIDGYKSLNISIVTVIKIPGMLKFIPYYHKLIKCVGIQLKKLCYLLVYVLDQYKTQQMCDKTILENGETLNFAPDCYKNQEMCNKAFDIYPQALDFLPEYYKTQKICDKVVNSYSSTTKFIPECVSTQELCDKAVNRYFLYLILFLISIKLKKCVTELFLKIVF